MFQPVTLHWWTVKFSTRKFHISWMPQVHLSQHLLWSCTWQQLEGLFPEVVTSQPMADGRAPSMNLGNTSEDLLHISQGFWFFLHVSWFFNFVFFCFQTLIGTWIIEKCHLLLLWGSLSLCPWAVSFLLSCSQRPMGGSCSFLYCLTKAALWFRRPSIKAGFWVVFFSSCTLLPPDCALSGPPAIVHVLQTSPAYPLLWGTNHWTLWDLDAGTESCINSKLSKILEVSNIWLVKRLYSGTSVHSTSFKKMKEGKQWLAFR